MGLPTATCRLGVVLAAFHGALEIEGERRRTPPLLPLAPLARGGTGRARGAAAVEEPNDVGVTLVLLFNGLLHGLLHGGV